MCLADLGLFWAEIGYFLQSATLYAHFSESKKRRSKECKSKDFRGSNAAAKANYTCGWLSFAYWGRKRVIYCHVQPYSPSFRNRKGGALKSVNQKIFAVQTPQRKLGFFSTRQTIVGKTFPHLRSFKSSLADAPHCSIMGFVQTFDPCESKGYFLYFLTVNRTRFSARLA